MASDESGSMQQRNAGDAKGFQVQAQEGSEVYQAGNDVNLNPVTQQAEGDQNQILGKVIDSVVLYVSGGSPIINLPQAEKEVPEAETPQQQDIGPCPYRGLLAYHEQDSEYYFGRTKEITVLWQRFRDLHGGGANTRFLPIYGPSGSGKSSLVRAGLIPKLAKQPLPGKDKARVAVMVPATQPLQRLAGILAQIATQDAMAVRKTREFAEELALRNAAGVFDGLHRIASLLPEIQTMPLVVVVDQFEEVYALCKDTEERDAFIGNLLYAAAEMSQCVSVIVTFRSDFLGETSRHASLNELFSDQGFLAPTMKEAALREAIAQPAENAGFPLDEGTINLLIEQTRGREGALPLLQFALTRIWEGMGRGVAPAKTLREIGGVGGALAGTAQRIYDGLDKQGQDIARRFFLGLVQLGEGVQDTRRRVPVSSLVAAGDETEQVRAVMGQFVSPQARLITLSSEGEQEQAEVSHEALIQHWGALRQWIEQNRDLLRQQRKIEASALAWREQGEQAGYFLQGLPLTEAIRFNQQQNDLFPLSNPTRAFVQRSIEYRRWTRLKATSWFVLPILLLGVVIEQKLRERMVQENQARLDQKGSYSEKQAVEALVEGCYGSRGEVGSYWKEVLFGSCRSLSRAPLNEADLSSVDLRSANLSKANLSKANLSQANLTNAANLSSANLRRANLSSANLSSANLSYADLDNTNLRRANLISANLRNSYLRLARACFKTEGEF